MLLRLFLRLNEADLMTSGTDKSDTMMRLAAGALGKEALSVWICGHMAVRAAEPKADSLRTDAHASQ
ncbi:MAG: hypothetical protein ACXIU8_02130 [Alkalilacustris sp.]